MGRAWRIEYEGGLLVYLVWKICILANKETRRLFGMTYSATSHLLSSIRTRTQKDSVCGLNAFIHNVTPYCMTQGVICEEFPVPTTDSLAGLQAFAAEIARHENRPA